MADICLRAQVAAPTVRAARVNRGRAHARLARVHSTGRSWAVVNVSMQEALYRLLMALACGAVVGLNRDRHRKSAGFRTFSLVSVGSAVVALAMTETSSDANAVSRVIQGVLTGIGFLGAGVIL